MYQLQNSIKVNPELYFVISKEGISQDIPLKFVNQALAKGLQPLITAWSKIIEAENAIKDANEGTKEAVISVLDGVPLNLTSLQELLTLSLMILGNANVQTVHIH